MSEEQTDYSLPKFDQEEAREEIYNILQSRPPPITKKMLEQEQITQTDIDAMINAYMTDFIANRHNPYRVALTEYLLFILTKKMGYTLSYEERTTRVPVLQKPTVPVDNPPIGSRDSDDTAKDWVGDVAIVKR